MVIGNGTDMEEIRKMLERYPIINREWVYVNCRGLADSISEHFNDYVIVNGNDANMSLTCELYKKACIRAYGGIWGHFVRRVDGKLGNLAIKNVDMWNREFPKYRNFGGLYNDPYKADMGKIDAGIFYSMSDESFQELFVAMKQKNFAATRKWIAEHSDYDSTVIFRKREPRCRHLILH